MTFRKVALSAIAAASVLLSTVAFAQEGSEPPTAQQQEIQKIAEQVRKQIVTLSVYGVFDNIYFGIKNPDTVILYGKASRPTLKSSAERVVKQIQGIKNVDNQIEVLPVSPNDDRIRAQVYAAIYRYAPLQKYSSTRGRIGPGGPSVARMAGGITNDPPIGWHAIHIIVQNGNVTLVGVVNNDGDFALAEMRANGVSGVFSVTNELQVAAKTK